ncbi:polymerase [Limosilactobacillus difficilis]|uniref:polymerase n=1 Tax=Limosilactobacillus difficilis TaxID=2991838 RepID=UPI0024BAF347|nr:polymerase [Limosilactobacillus difficilis]
MKLLSSIKQGFHYKITGEQIYFVAFTICLFVSWIISSMFMQYFSYLPLNMLLAIGIVLFIFKIYLFDDYLPWQILLITIILGLTVISEIKSHSNLILLMMLMILAARNVDFNQLIRWYYYIGLIMLSLIIVYSLFGVINNLQFHAVNRATRYSLGVVYPTDLAAHVLYLLLADAFLHRKSLTGLRYFAYLIIACVTMKITDGRLSFFASLLMIVVLAIAQWAQKGNRAAKLIASIYWIVIPIEAFIAVMSSIYFDMNNHIFSHVDRLLSGRLFYSHEAFSRYSFAWLGNKIAEHGYGGVKGAHLFNGKLNMPYFYVDSSYIRLFVMYGIVMAIIVIAIMMVIAIKATSHANYIFAAIILVVSCSCMVEQHLLEVSFNPFLIALLATVYPLEDYHAKL